MVFWVLVARFLVPEGNGTRGGYCEREEEPFPTLSKDNSPLMVQKRFEHSRGVAGFTAVLNLQEIQKYAEIWY